MNRKKKISKTLFERSNHFLASKLNIVFYSSVVISILIFYSLFDIRVSLSGDDSEYIVRAYDFLRGKFPTFQGPLYPIVLSPFIALFGVSVPILKILSSLFLLGSYYFFYKSLKDKISAINLFLIIIIVAINSFVAFYSTHTFSEAFYMLIQSLLFYLFFKYIIDDEKINIGHFLLLGLLTLFLYLTRTVGIVGIMAVSLYFLIEKNWKKLIASILSFSGFFILLSVAKKLFWKIDGSLFSSQLEILLRKHPYQPALGNENFVGFIQRFWDNSNLYLSNHLSRFIGFKSFNSTEISPLLTIIIYALIILAIVYSFRRNKYILFITLYGVIFLGVTFLIIQKFWNQDRLIIPLFPILITSIFFGIFQFFSLNKYRNFQFVPVLFGLLIILTSLKTTFDRIEENKPILKNSLKGDMIFGYTPDWQNYLLMSKYAGENVPQNENIACRKAGISFIYGEHNFHGINSVPEVNIDELFLEGKKLYSIPNGDELLKQLPASQLKAIFLGKTNKNDAIQTINFLFELDSNFVASNNIENLYTTKEILQSYSELSVFSPDQLLENLKEHNIQYVIIASLRTNPNQKTESTINTVSRYFSYISIKYPAILTKVHEIGQDEKATLYKINHNQQN